MRRLGKCLLCLVVCTMSFMTGLASNYPPIDYLADCSAIFAREPWAHGAETVFSGTFQIREDGYYLYASEKDYHLDNRENSIKVSEEVVEGELFQWQYDETIGTDGLKGLEGANISVNGHLDLNDHGEYAATLRLEPTGKEMDGADRMPTKTFVGDGSKENPIHCALYELMAAPHMYKGKYIRLITPCMRAGDGKLLSLRYEDPVEILRISKDECAERIEDKTLWGMYDEAGIMVQAEIIGRFEYMKPYDYTHGTIVDVVKFEIDERDHERIREAYDECMRQKEAIFNQKGAQIESGETEK